MATLMEPFNGRGGQVDPTQLFFLQRKSKKYFGGRIMYSRSDLTWGMELLQPPFPTLSKRNSYETFLNQNSLYKYLYFTNFHGLYYVF